MISHSVYIITAVCVAYVSIIRALGLVMCMSYVESDVTAVLRGNKHYQKLTLAYVIWYDRAASGVRASAVCRLALHGSSCSPGCSAARVGLRRSTRSWTVKGGAKGEDSVYNAKKGYNRQCGCV
jgi:hypothetical protein